MPKLSDWKWAIDYSNAAGQKDAEINPMLFKSRNEARKSNKGFPKGVVRKIRITVIKSK